MLDDLSKSVKAQLYERASSPLFGSFLLAWSCWNYRLIFILLTAGDAEKKLAYIDSHIYIDTWTIAYRAFLGPAVSAVAFIYCYPLVSNFLYTYWQNKQKELKEIQQRIEDVTPLTQEEARQLRNTLREAEANFDKSMSEKEKLIEELNSQLQQKDEEMQTMKKDISPSNSLYPTRPAEIDINENQFNILKRLAAQSLNGMPQAKVLEEFGPDRIKTEGDIDKLKDASYASEFRGSNGAWSIRITPQGRERYLKEREKANKS